ncbi:FAD:protein FMN transferase [Adhaeribacter aquaticus]|uniref:FAD:protein FMN transferase n=1 Tax=Adhaeribacter aquaticus TaxID=299567 RepID=UPI0004187D9F|nr:FAD:protein FMN transferase [Adhaeribacter aquaticus]
MSGTAHDYNFNKKLIICLFLFLWVVAIPGIAQNKVPHRFAFSQPHMGTLFRIVLYATDSVKAQRAAEAGFKRVAQLNKILSDYNPESEVNKLCRTAGSGKWVPVSQDLWFILNKSAVISRKTQGAFDITVGPYVQLWRRTRRTGILPSPEDALAQAKNLVGPEKIKLDKNNKSVLLTTSGMQLDLGAIGKGYAVDEAMKTLKAYGIKSALVDGGGNIAVSKAPPQSKGWLVSFLLPQPTDSANQVPLFLEDKGLATSGDLYQYIHIDGTRYSHILNPTTGLGLTDQSLVTVITRNGIEADWLSTAVSVLGPEKGIRLANQEPKTAAIFTYLNSEANIVQVYSKSWKRYQQKYLKKKDAK